MVVFWKVLLFANSVLVDEGVKDDEIAWLMFGISLSGYNLLASLTLGFFSFFSAKRLLKRPT